MLARVDELRRRLVHTAMTLLGLIGIGFFFAGDLIQVLKIPLREALPKQREVLHFTGPLEVMLAYMKVAFLIGIVAGAPVIFYQIWRYLGPSLPSIQKRLVLPFAAVSLLLFIGGGAFGYLLMLPMGLKWLVGFGAGQAQAVITVQEYVDLVAFMLLAFGFAFQLPLVLIVLERLGLISATTLRRHRGVVLVIILIVAAIAAPSPDPLSQLTLAAPLYILFEAALLIIARLQRHTPKPPATMKSGDHQP